jgi:hypothetical protein
MKYHLNFLITAHFVIAAICNAMESQQNLCTEITAAKHPRQAIFITDHQAIINGEDGCSIVDLQKNKEVKKISDCKWQHLALHPNKTKIALYNTDELKIFDTQTGNEEWKRNNLEIKSIVFDNQNVIFLVQDHNYIKKIDYQETQFTDLRHYGIYTGLYSPKNIYFMLTAEFLGTAISVLDNNHSLDFKKYIKITADSNFFKCSPNGSLLTIGNSQTLRLLDVSDDYKTCGFLNWSKIGFKVLQFHPNSLYITRLVHKETGIYLVYHNKKGHPTAGTLIPINESKKKSPESDSASISFAPNGKNALVTLYNQCISVPVPFEIIYQDDAKKKAISAYWALKNYKTNTYDIPQEINQHLLYSLLETLKR